MRKRSVGVEPLFGEAKQWHGLRQFRLRGLDNVNMEALLVATGQNLKRWLAKAGWGRRHGPQGCLLARPTAPERAPQLPARRIRPNPRSPGRAPPGAPLDR
ncbi:MAG: transposase [Myxococcaceae bacterium]